MAKDVGYFVKLENPKQARRIILENARDILRILQGYEDFKTLRDKRTHLIGKFKNEVEEASSMVLELKRMLPKMTIKETKKFVMEAQQPVKEVKKLEQELADIEERLSSLS